jgi:nucleoside-diphosphate-sugar epimerase
MRLWADNSKIIQLTGFQPDYSLKEGLTETIKWFLDSNNLSKYKANAYNV